MTEKRFTFVKNNNKTIGIFDNKYERKISEWGRIARLLNELDSENKKLKKQLESQMIMLDNAILLERTRMGKNCLKQYREAIQ